MDTNPNPGVLKILIVEDEPSIAELYTHVLSKAGYQIKVVSGAVDALSTLQTETFQVMFLDLMMPKVNGLEFLKSLQIYQKNNNMKILVLSNVDQESVIKQAYELGAQSYLIKSEVAPTQLVQIVKNALNPAGAPGQAIQGERKSIGFLSKIFGSLKKN